ncbi:DNA (cytosine-5-)-methyltransferase [Bacteroides neonati]|uniref:DNA (cytosine-5-)-methyltransferase n=1 Tax=Bacteroides neonati TaxID=1347393 RepID=UPI0004AEBEF3|nr:DNA (cytosine-5-)-methyltransferase [Bacteroides neonati]
MRKIVHASLFSGFGGPDLAAKWMGWDNAFHCEINEFCNTILEYWFPKSKTYKDVTTADFTEWRGKIDVLTGGFPCQPFSVAGQRKGADDNRYLWPHFLRVIREVRPTWVIGENVGGILTMVQPGEEIEVGCQASLFEENDKETILEQEFVVETICKDLECEGYSVQPILIPACAVGAPHRRDRIWFIAYRTDARAEGLQSGWEDGVLSGTSITDTYGKRCNNRSDNWEERPIYYDWQRYSEKDQSEWDKREYRTSENGSVASYTYCQKFQERIETRRWSNEAKVGFGVDDGTKRFGSLRYASYSNRFGLQAWLQPNCHESNRREVPYGYATKYSVNNRRALHAATWQDFPTQSPVCRGDDGISCGLDGITFSKWRQESVKGFGNAIVPQVVLEIFKMIEEIYTNLIRRKLTA